MIIKDVRTTLLRVPFVEKPQMMGAPSERPREIVVVEIETQSGLVGTGYVMLLGGGIGTVVACLRELMVPRLLGKDATAVEAIWRDLWTSSYTIGRMGLTVVAQSAVDIALWDLVGQRAGMPLHRLWGHYRSEVPVYGSGCWRGMGGDGMIEKALSYVEQGYRAIKMQVGHLYDARTDVDNVRRMRDALGPDIDIMIDVNMAWTADNAILMGRKFEEYDVFWLEEPVRAEDFKGYMRIAEALDLRIVGGETHFTRYDLRPFLEHPKLPILQPDMIRGGLTELRKIAALADTWGMMIAPHLYDELMIQLMASIPNGHMLEHMGFMDDLWVEPILPENGVVKAPERPGHGLRFKPEIMRDCAVEA